MDNAQQCDRAGDLMAWLYGEASPNEAQSLQRHLQDCKECSENAKSFGAVRQSLVAWRDESLGSFVPASASTYEQVPQRRSAVAAIRQFFDLSPLWMKAAVSFAAIVFFLLATFSVMRMQQSSQPNTQPGRVYTEQELASLVEQRAQQKLEELQARARETATPEKSEQTPQVIKERINRRAGAVQVAKVTTGVRGPLTRQEREQLAADLRLTEPDDPELDLIEDRITRPDQ